MIEKEIILATRSKLETHEAVCAERYAGINARLRRVEGILIGGTAGLLSALGAVIVLLTNIVSKVN